MIEIDADLVERKLIEHFAADDRDTARTVLAAMDTGAFAVNRWRVQLAAIRLSGGDPDTLERYVLLAAIDWRDVLAPAESPRYDWNASAEEKTRLVELDRHEYQAWIEEPGPYAPEEDVQ